MGDEFKAAAANRSIRSIKLELAFLADASIISQSQLTSVLSQLPDEKEAGLDRAASISHAPTPQMQNVNLNGYDEKERNGFAPVHSPSPMNQPPPAYPTAPAPPSALTFATALYAYNPTDAGDLALQPNDRIAVTEYMNAEWWKGRSDKTGQEGIFPRSYVRVEEKMPPGSNAMPPVSPNRTQETNYGNMPMAVSQSGSGPSMDPAKKSKFEEGGKKFGKKMGNAAIFGAGATVGGKIVNGIF